MLNDLLPIADVIYCASLDGFKGSISPFDERVHNVRPHPGQLLVAKRIREIMQDSKILASHIDCDKVRDPYSFRCAPSSRGCLRSITRNAINYPNRDEQHNRQSVGFPRRKR